MHQVRTELPLLDGGDGCLLKCRIVTIHGLAAEQANVKRAQVRNFSILTNGESDDDLPRHLRLLYRIGVVRLNSREQKSFRRFLADVYVWTFCLLLCLLLSAGRGYTQTKESYRRKDISDFHSPLC